MPSVAGVMAAITDEDFQRMLTAFAVRGYEVVKKGQVRKTVLDEKNFRFMEKNPFDGSAGRWEEWSFHLKMTVTSIDSGCGEALEDIKNKAALTRDAAAIRIDSEVKEKFSAELFRVLCWLTTGEANVVVRSVVETGAGFCGFAAWCRLVQRFNPRTPARVLQYLTTVLNPPQIKDVRHLERAVEDWEMRKGKLKSEFDEELSDNICVAILTSMIPRDLQDMVFQMGHTGEELRYKAVRDKVMGIANHRAQMTIPAPMDVGCLDRSASEDQDEEYDGDAWQQVDAVSNLQCYVCGGWGHYAAECATQKNKGKGKGKSKGAVNPGWGKGGEKAAGKGSSAMGKGVDPKGSGKGKGYQGTCFRCGVVGHKAAECQWFSPRQIGEVAPSTPPPALPTVPVAQVAPASASSVGGVWAISQVTVAKEDEESLMDGWTLVRGRWRKAREPVYAMPLREVPTDFRVSAGRFSPLMVSPVVKEDDGQADVCGVATEITVDSAAEESVCPLHWAEQFGLEPVPKGREMKLVNASGGKIAHWGSRKVTMHNEETGRALEMGFQVTDVKKPLLAVSRLCERGNVVQFGPEPHHNFVMNVATGERISMRRRGNSWVLPGELYAQSRFGGRGDGSDSR